MKNGPISPAKIEGDVEMLVSQRVHHLPLLGQSSFFAVQLQGPGMVNGRHQAQHVRADRRSQHVELGPRVAALEFLQRGNQVDRVPEKAQVHHNYFAGLMCSAVEMCQIRRHSTDPALIPKA
jgi:hypothetical protein